MAAVKEFSARQQHRSGLVLLPVVLLGLLLVPLVLLPAHGTPGPESLMRAMGDSSAIEHSTHSASTGHDGHGSADHSHGPDGGDPACHAETHVAHVIPNRLPGDDAPAQGAGAVLPLMAGVLAVSLLLPRPPPLSRWWCSRPPWRPAGTDLLTRVCIART